MLINEPEKIPDMVEFVTPEVLPKISQLISVLTDTLANLIFTGNDTVRKDAHLQKHIKHITWLHVAGCRKIHDACALIIRFRLIDPVKLLLDFVPGRYRIK